MHAQAEPSEELVGPDGRWQSRTARGAGRRKHPGLRNSEWTNFAATQHRWLQGGDTDLMP